MSDLLTKEWMTKRGAWIETIDFFERNGLLGLPIKWILDNSEGDYQGCITWLMNAFYINYTYDSMGNVISKTYENGDAFTYTYDNDGNMLSATHPNGKVYTYTYDKYGNQTSMTDDNGDILSYVFEHENGRLTRAHGLTLPVYNEGGES